MRDHRSEQIYRAVAREAERTTYPESFPVLPEVPAARYSDPHF
jgi:hypothetical protein